MSTRPSDAYIDTSASERIEFRYDPGRDIANAHLGAPLAAVYDDADDGWYLGLAEERDGSLQRVVSIEIHAFRTKVLDSNAFAQIVAAAAQEIRGHCKRGFDAELDLVVTRDAMPRTHEFLLFLFGWSMGAHHMLWKHEEALEPAR